MLVKYIYRLKANYLQVYIFVKIAKYAAQPFNGC